MRGGEGLAKAIQYSYFTAGKNNVYLPFFNTSEVSIHTPGGEMALAQRSQYPFNGRIELEVLHTQINRKSRLYLFAPEWADNPTIMINDKPVSYRKKDGFLVLKSKLKKGDKIDYSFDMRPQMQQLSNKTLDRPGHRKITYGPLVLGYPGSVNQALADRSSISRLGEGQWQVGDNNPLLLTPVFHVLDPTVNEASGYQKQLIFKVKE